MSALPNPWFGDAPCGWQRGQLKRFYSVRLGKMLQPNQTSPRDELLPYMRAANITWEGPDISDIKEMWASPSEILGCQLESGDLLVSEGGDVGRSCLWNGEIARCIFQNAINRVRSRRQNSTRFLLYLMTAVKASGWIDILCNKATIAHFTAEKVNALEILLPALPDQHRIVAYLDEQTAKIDRLMDMRRRQMELLKEQRAALIQQAVTRGLNPNVPMKDSGIPWLGEVPAHWVVERGRFLVLSGRSSIKPGPFGTQLKTSDYVEEGIKIFNQETIISKDFQRGEDYITFEKYSDLKEFEVRGGDLLLTTRGTIGRCAAVQSDEVKAIIHPCLMRIRFDPQIMTNEYAVAYIEETDLFLQQVNYMSNATTIEVIYSENFRQILFPVPPIEEQQEITAWIRNPNDPVLATMNGYARQLTLLAEYRASLIHECVTGQQLVNDASPTKGLFL